MKNTSHNSNTIYTAEGFSHDLTVHTKHSGSCKCGGKGSKCKSKKTASVLRVK